MDHQNLNMAAAATQLNLLNSVKHVCNIETPNLTPQLGGGL